MTEIIDRILSDERISFPEALILLERYLKSLPKNKKNELILDLKSAFFSSHSSSTLNNSSPSTQ